MGQGCLAAGHAAMEEPRTLESLGLLPEVSKPSLEPVEGWSTEGWARTLWGRDWWSWASPLPWPSIPAAAEEVSLKLPENILEGSQRAHVTVMGKGCAEGAELHDPNSAGGGTPTELRWDRIRGACWGTRPVTILLASPGAGDIMGNALQNVDRLLAMPYGCGEQNMVRFAPNIYIQQYLEKSGQLTPDIRAKAQSFLQSGQRPRPLLPMLPCLAAQGNPGPPTSVPSSSLSPGVGLAPRLPLGSSRVGCRAPCESLSPSPCRVPARAALQAC